MERRNTPARRAKSKGSGRSVPCTKSEASKTEFCRRCPRLGLSDSGGRGNGFGQWRERRAKETHAQIAALKATAEPCFIAANDVTGRRGRPGLLQLCGLSGSGDRPSAASAPVLKTCL